MIDKGLGAKYTDLGLDYNTALHGMQSGVAFFMQTAKETETRDSGTEPKHLRVGVNSALVSNGALVTLLVDKGLITMEEYAEYLRLAMNNEVATFEQDASAMLGRKVSFR